MLLLHLLHFHLKFLYHIMTFSQSNFTLTLRYVFSQRRLFIYRN